MATIDRAPADPAGQRLARAEWWRRLAVSGGGGEGLDVGGAKRQIRLCLVESSGGEAAVECAREAGMVAAKKVSGGNGGWRDDEIRTALGLESRASA